MDDEHLVLAVRYIKMNQVAAGLVEHPEEYPWSSARAHLEGKDDGITQDTALLEIVGN